MDHLSASSRAFGRSHVSPNIREKEVRKRLCLISVHRSSRTDTPIQQLRTNKIFSECVLADAEPSQCGLGAVPPGVAKPWGASPMSPGAVNPNWRTADRTQWNIEGFTATGAQSGPLWWRVEREP